MKEGSWTVEARYTDMVATELVILGVLNVLTLSGLVVLALWIRKELEEGLSELDGALAAALKNAIDSITGGDVMAFDPPNPIQVAISQLISSMAAQKMGTVEAIVTERGPGGKFKKSMKDLE